MAITLWPNSSNKDQIQLYPSSKTNHEIDLRQEFFDLMDGTDSDPQRGHWVLLRRMSTAQRCSCWNERGVGDYHFSDDKRKYDEPDKDCIVCKGEGWLYSEELHKVRRRLATPPTGLGDSENLTDVGIINIPLVVYYFKYYVSPTEDDKIIEVDNSEDGTPTRPFVKREIFNISTAEPFRDLNGRIEYWRCTVKKEEFRHG